MVIVSLAVPLFLSPILSFRNDRKKKEMVLICLHLKESDFPALCVRVINKSESGEGWDAFLLKKK